MSKFRKITTLEDLQKAFAIREEVFVLEQEVDKELEYDEFEKEASHFLATNDAGLPIGTARWRYTENGIKLERFAIIKSYRGFGYGKGLMEIMLEDIKTVPENEDKKIYLHAQLQALPFYKGLGFISDNITFEEAGILHNKMILSK